MENNAIMEEKKRVSSCNYLRPGNLLEIEVKICSPLWLLLTLHIETFVHHNKGTLVSENNDGVILVFQAFTNTASHYKGASVNIYT